MLGVTILCVVIVVAAHGRADACSCSALTIVPGPDDQVPTNARFVAHDRAYYGASTLRLEGPFGEFPTTLSVEQRGEREAILTLTVDALLDPGARYQLVYDDGRGDPWSFAVTALEAADQQPPPGVVPKQLIAQMWRAAEDAAACFLAPGGWHRALSIVTDPLPGDVALVLVRFYDSADADQPYDQVQLTPSIFYPSELNVADLVCGAPPPAITPGAPLCADVISVDLAGNTSVPSTRVCTDVSDCGSTTPRERGGSCEPPGCIGCRTGGAARQGFALVAVVCLVLRRRRRR